MWLEERKLEEQMLQREEQRLQREEQRLQREEHRLQRQSEERRWQEQKEFEERKWREELELKRNEHKYRESTAVKVKMWGDALRNVICRMPNESVEVVSVFVSVEKNCLTG